MGKINWKKSLLLLCICAMAVFGLAGCKTDSGEPKGESMNYMLYYVNPAYVNTGDESLEKLMAPVEGTLEISEEKPVGDYLLEVVNKLKSPPSEYATALTDRFTINSILVEDGTAIVDFAGSGLQDGGPMEESLVINQIFETITNSTDLVIQVQFTVDGEVAETLMGYTDISNPITADVE